MMSRLKQMNAWLEEQAGDEETLTFEASQCLQCGLCLEVCPEFYAEGDFGGMAAMTTMARLMLQTGDSQKKKLYAAYRRSIFAGCAKSLACRDVCPAGIAIDHLLARSNAAALWRR